MKYYQNFNLIFNQNKKTYNHTGVAVQEIPFDGFVRPIFEFEFGKNLFMPNLNN